MKALLPDCLQHSNEVSDGNTIKTPSQLHQPLKKSSSRGCGCWVQFQQEIRKFSCRRYKLKTTQTFIINFQSTTKKFAKSNDSQPELLFYLLSPYLFSSYCLDFFDGPAFLIFLYWCLKVWWHQVCAKYTLVFSLQIWSSFKWSRKARVLLTKTITMSRKVSEQNISCYVNKEWDTVTTQNSGYNKYEIKDILSSIYCLNATIRILSVWLNSAIHFGPSVGDGNRRFLIDNLKLRRGKWLCPEKYFKPSETDWQWKMTRYLHRRLIETRKPGNPFYFTLR